MFVFGESPCVSAGGKKSQSTQLEGFKLFDDCLFPLHPPVKQQPRKGMGTGPFLQCPRKISCQERPDSSLNHKSRNSQRKQISKTWVSWIYKYICQILNYPRPSSPFPEILLYSMNPAKRVLHLQTLLGLPGTQTMLAGAGCSCRLSAHSWKSPSASTIKNPALA